MRLTIAYSKIKNRNLVLIKNDTHQRETLSEQPIRPPLSQKRGSPWLLALEIFHKNTCLSELRG